MSADYEAMSFNEMCELYDQLKAANAELVEALAEIASMQGTENDEWDAVERLIPEMCAISRAALIKHQGATA